MDEVHLRYVAIVVDVVVRPPPEKQLNHVALVVGVVVGKAFLVVVVLSIDRTTV